MALRALALSLLAPAGLALAQPNLDAGEKLYEVCAGCHGFQGEGNALVAAPSLAGIEPWYLARQMADFSAGVRGVSGDVHGERMAVMAGAVRNEREREDLSAYVATLPREHSAPRVAGNRDAGAQRYAVCAACHGTAGEGSETLSAPALNRLPGWYVLEQLRLYADGLRGARPEDTYGQQMRALAATFADDESRRDLASYVESLAADAP